MSSTFRYILFTLAALCSWPSAASATGTVQIVALRDARLWERAEFRIDHAPVASNSFDPEQLRIDATFTLPSGKSQTLPAFWYQEFRRTFVDGAESLSPVGDPHWRIRFTPTEPGDHVLSLSIQVKGVGSGAPVVSHFTVPASAGAGHPGWARVSSDARSLETSDGRPLRLSGENVCWDTGRGTYDFDRWFGSMRQSGQNFARLWMCPWSLGLEHKPGTLNRYDLQEAWKLDHVFEEAERNGLYLMLCFDHHGMYHDGNGGNAFWSGNPYNALLGGPCSSPNDFFVNPAAKDIYKKRLRYLVGRFSYSPMLLSWQLQNEVDNGFGTLKEADVIAWHREMGASLRAQDPFRHLVTTSLKGCSDRPSVWNMPEMDISMYHSYEDAAPARKFASLAESYLRRYKKPVMIGEFGISPAAWNLSSDPYLRGLRQSLWGGALGGSVGTAMPWWWESIHNDNAYPLYGALKAILDRSGWQEGAWTPLAFSTNDPVPTQIGEILPQGDVITVSLPLSQAWLGKVRGSFAVADRLSAERASEFLHGYVQGTENPDMRQPFILSANFADKARFILSVGSVSTTADLRVKIDGAEVFKQKWDTPAASEPRVRNLNADFAVAVPAGKHCIEVCNTGEDWVRLNHVTLEGVRESAFPNGWHFEPEPIGLRCGGKAALYVTSPWTVYPAGALRYDTAPLLNQTLRLRDWPTGKYVAHWFDPRDGRELGTTEAITSDHLLTLPLPPISDDLAAIVAPIE